MKLKKIHREVHLVAFNDRASFNRLVRRSSVRAVQTVAFADGGVQLMTNLISVLLGSGSIHSQQRRLRCQPARKRPARQ